MKIRNGKKILNILLLIFGGALIITQYLILRRSSSRRDQIGAGSPSGTYKPVPDHDTLAQLLPDSLFNRDNSKLIVLRVLYNDCKECRDSIFEGAKRLTSRIGENNLCVVAGNYPEDQFLAYKRLYSYNIRNFIQVSEKIAALDSGSSYYFMINKKLPGKAGFIFIPDPNNHGRTEVYFDKLAFLFN